MSIHLGGSFDYVFTLVGIHGYFKVIDVFA